MLRNIVALALMAAVSGGMVSKCPMAVGKFPFDLEKFQGDWFIYASNEDALEEKDKCGKHNFTYNKDHKDGEAALYGRFTGVSVKDNTAIAYDNYLTPLYSDKSAIFHGVSRKEGTNAYSPIDKAAILASDYSTYALFLACRPEFDMNTKVFKRALFGEVWTRQGVSLSKDTLETLTSVLSSYDIDPPSIKMYERKC